MKRMLAALWHLFAVLGAVGIAALAAFAWQGISARSEPGGTEVFIARAARRALIPSAERSRSNPFLPTKETVRAGLEHWADHCAMCHANDGSGETTIGRGLYPRVPDMRLHDTQDLTDGELFYIIEHGVKITGMPAWGTGTPEGEQASWHLVSFIRHLPALTAEELVEMEELNPRTPEEWRALEEERRFLAGETDTPPKPKQPTHEHKGSQE